MDGLEQQYHGRLAVMRVDFASAAGQQLARRYQVRAHPAVVVIDAASNARYTQPGIPDGAQVARAIDLVLVEEHR